VNLDSLQIPWNSNFFQTETQRYQSISRGKIFAERSLFRKNTAFYLFTTTSIVISISKYVLTIIIMTLLAVDSAVWSTIQLNNVEKIVSFDILTTASLPAVASFVFCAPLLTFDFIALLLTCCDKCTAVFWKKATTQWGYKSTQRCNSNNNFFAEVLPHPSSEEVMAHPEVE